MNLGEVKTRVKRQFGDESAVQITDEDVTRWTNDAINYILMNNQEVMEKIASIDLIANQSEYSVPPDLMSLKSLHLKSNPDGLSWDKLPGYDLQKFDEYVSGWDGSYFGTGCPVAYNIYADLIRIFPIPDMDVASGIKLYYTRKPVPLTNGDDSVDLDLPIGYHNGVVQYCLQQAYEMDENFDASAMKGSQVENSIRMNKGNENRPNKEFYPTITTSYDDAW